MDFFPHLNKFSFGFKTKLAASHKLQPFFLGSRRTKGALEGRDGALGEPPVQSQAELLCVQSQAELLWGVGHEKCLLRAGQSWFPQAAGTALSSCYYSGMESHLQHQGF